MNIKDMGLGDRGHLMKLGDVATIVMGQSPPGSTVSDESGIALLNGPTEFGPHHPAPVQFTTAPRKVRPTRRRALLCARVDHRGA